MRDFPPPNDGNKVQIPSASSVEAGGDNFLYVESRASSKAGWGGFVRELFSADGRYARDRFWVVYLGAVALAAIAPGLLPSPLLMSVFLLALTWVLFCCIVKRFHDRSKSGWWVLVGFIPFLGTAWILVECGLLEGSSGVNVYGGRAMTLRDVYAKGEAHA